MPMKWMNIWNWINKMDKIIIIGTSDLFEMIDHMFYKPTFIKDGKEQKVARPKYCDYSILKNIQLTIGFKGSDLNPYAI